jgi:D-hexose-6-phosphate mutarotase
VTVEELQSRFGRPGAVAFAESAPGVVVVELSSEASTATVALQGGQVLSWAPRGQPGVLWSSSAARLGNGRAFRGGIPVCWPWFGPHPSGGSFPAHGFVRTMTWAVDAAEAGNDAAILRLAPVLGEEERKLWPEDAAVSVEIRAGADLQVTLSTENAGERALQITQALHTYLAVGNIEDVRVLGLDGRSFVDQLTREVRAQGGEIAIGEEVDRIYFDTANEVVVRDESLRRRIRIAKDGSQSTVVWNPWIEKSARLADMTADGYKHMLCIETANAGPDVVTIEPGRRHNLVARLSVEAMPPSG